MSERLCKICKESTIKISLEATDYKGFHIHHMCSSNEDHPYYCETTRRWVG